ncbi:MAG: GWxTD domain-containing protein [Candidatus Aminicenantia bacterium]
MKKMFFGIFLFSFLSLFLLFSEEKEQIPQKYLKWLNEEVIYIISSQEREVFLSLRTDEERENFIKIFWKRRDPSPDTEFNEFKEEHYRRIEYANRNFFEGMPGWKTDRGRVYIMFGPPDFILTNPGGLRGFLFGPKAETAEFPSEVWTYRYLPGLKTRQQNIEFIFVNYYNTGVYKLTMSSSLANALRNVSTDSRFTGYNDDPRPGQGVPRNLSDLEVQRMAQDRNIGTGDSVLGQLALLSEITRSRGEILEELERSNRLRKLKGLVFTRDSVSTIKFDSFKSVFREKEEEYYVPIAIQVELSQLTFTRKGDKYVGELNFYVSVLKGGLSTYEGSDRLEMNLSESTYRQLRGRFYQYHHSVSLPPGEYLLKLILMDGNSSSVGYSEEPLKLPPITRDILLSDVIIAESVEKIEEKKEEISTKELEALKVIPKIKVPEKISLSSGKSPFVFNELFVIPRIKNRLRKNQELVFFYQIYPQDVDSKIRVENFIEKDGKRIAIAGEPIMIEARDLNPVNYGAKMPLSNFERGDYVLKVVATELISGKKVEKSITFNII